LFLQDHLISSQLFVFGVVFVLVGSAQRGRRKVSEEARIFARHTSGFLTFSPKVLVRDFCEVEFWEVLRFGKSEAFLTVVALNAHRLTAN
jgi:hypothetical protein